MTDNKFKIIDKYEELSPMEVRLRMKEHQDISDFMDGCVDKCYDLQKRIVFYTNLMSLKQLELKALIFGGLTKEDSEAYDKLKKEAKYEPRLQSVQ